MNKHFILLISALCLTANAWANEAANTDSISIANAKNVIIVEKDGQISLEVKGLEGNPEYTYSRTMSKGGETIVKEENKNIGFRIPFVDRDNNSDDIVKTRRSRFSFGVNLGGLGWVATSGAPADLKTQMNHSLELNLDHMINVKYYPQGSNRTHYMLGFGMQWRHITLDNMRWMRSDDTRHITYGAWDDKYYDRNSRLNTYSLTVPLMIIQPLGKHFEIYAGAKACFNVGANAHSKYSYDDIKYTDSFKHLNQRVVTAEICGAIMWEEAIGLYFNYAPCKIFKTNMGPEMKTFTIGIAIGY